MGWRPYINALVSNGFQVERKEERKKEREEGREEEREGERKVMDCASICTCHALN